MAYTVIKQSLSLLDNREYQRADNERLLSTESAAKTINMLRAELDRAQAHYDDAEMRFERERTDLYQQYGRSRYLLGMLPVTVLVLPLSAIIAYLVFRSRLPFDASDMELGTMTFIAGAAGAAVSVMLRMTAGKLKFQLGLQPSEMIALGAFRPIVGSIFALALFFFIKSGLTPIAIPTDETAQLYFFPALGFIAGFSERLAKDTIKGAEGRLTDARVPADMSAE